MNSMYIIKFFFCYKVLLYGTLTETGMTHYCLRQCVKWLRVKNQDSYLKTCESSLLDHYLTVIFYIFFASHFFLFLSFKLEFYWLYLLYQCLSLTSSMTPCIEFLTDRIFNINLKYYMLCTVLRGDWKCGSGNSRSRSHGWKMQEWKKQEQIAGVENAGVSRMEHQTEIILKES